jgi:hypothetical protein
LEIDKPHRSVRSPTVREGNAIQELDYFDEKLEVDESGFETD